MKPKSDLRSVLSTLIVVREVVVIDGMTFVRRYQIKVPLPDHRSRRVYVRRLLTT